MNFKFMRNLRDPVSKAFRIIDAGNIAKVTKQIKFFHLRQ